MNLPLPLPESPDESVARIVENLRGARAHLDDARNTRALILAGMPQDEDANTVTGAHWLIENGLALDRILQWEAIVANVERVAAQYGIRPL